ncbi:PREDICTED: ectonucleoside triphosphate diphosphohydrolase 7, partial [Tinamus guttatus]|uniref:ectonucleoside triphosphate diphosphohydrolase 7 n=1 Tax=Tinamus guttatus TaxID=94827 RepID=UPI00052E813D
PTGKHKETPLYILCTAGMRLLPERQQAAILEDLVTNVPLEFDFLFSKSHAEVISGKQEGVYAWIGINFVLGRFEHKDEEDAVVTVAQGDQAESLVRKRTVGILDMGGASLQIAYEVPSSGTFSSPQQEEAAKSLLAEFNLGCDVQHAGHIYRVYVNTFLGFGGNFARQRYEELVLNQTYAHNSLHGQRTGLSAETPFLDPCLPVGLEDTVCFKSAWMYQVLHQGFRFPLDYPSLRTAQLVYDREVQWTLGAILYKTRFLPLRDLRPESIRQAHASWLRLSFVYNHYLFFACIVVVVLAIVLYLLRLRRIHRRQLRSAQLDLLWLDKVVLLPPGTGPGP